MSNEPEYERLKRQYPLRKTTYDHKAPHVEVLVVCRCGAGYRVWANGDTPIPVAAVLATGMTCNACGAEVADAAVYAGHSGGVFNATVVRQRGRGAGYCVWVKR